MKKRRNYQVLGDIELSSQEDKRITKMIDQAEDELELRISFRWGKEQLEAVKRAAQLIGVPYQTFLKLAVYERAINVLKEAEVLNKKKRHNAA